MEKEGRRSQGKQAKKKGSRRKWPWILLGLFIIVLLGVGFYAYNTYQQQIEAVNPENQEMQVVEIPEGSSVGQIGQILEEEDLIKNQEAFVLYSRVSADETYQAGNYQFNQSMPVNQISDILEEGSNLEVTNFTIPEGWNMPQVIELLSQTTGESQESIEEILEDEAFLEGLAETYPEFLTGAMEAKEDTIYTLEGYLFPATYEYREDYSVEDLIYQIVHHSNEVMSQYADQVEASDMSLHEILTFASLVEREAPQDKDRRLIAGVFYNRLEDDMMLQTDVSVAYAHGEHIEKTSYDDLEVDSPYNLYRHQGLGPGPFNNASQSAIEATLNPEDSDYYYFVADIETQENYFSETYEEHLANVDKYVNN